MWCDQNYGSLKKKKIFISLLKSRDLKDNWNFGTPFNLEQTLENVKSKIIKIQIIVKSAIVFKKFKIMSVREN